MERLKMLQSKGSQSVPELKIKSDQYHNHYFDRKSVCTLRKFG